MLRWPTQCQAEGEVAFAGPAGAQGQSSPEGGPRTRERDDVGSSHACWQNLSRGPARRHSQAAEPRRGAAVLSQAAG